MNIISKALIFAAGVAVGGVAAWVIATKRERKKNDAEWRELHESVAPIDKKLHEPGVQNIEVYDSNEKVTIFTEDAEHDSDEQTMIFTEDEFQKWKLTDGAEYFPRFGSASDEDDDQTDEGCDCYLIRLTYTYYADGVVTDENDICVHINDDPSWEKALNRLKTDETDCLYIVNVFHPTGMGCIREIAKDWRKYVDVHGRR